MTRLAHSAVPAPYKGLVAFEATELDALLFFGREAELEIVAANLLASRLTVLYGASGVGKSSLLRAGVVHHLRQLARQNMEDHGHPDFVVVQLSTWADDPVATLRAATRSALAEAFGSTFLDDREGESLTDTLDRWGSVLSSDILLILDQAEEYFLYHGEEGGLADELPELVTRPGLPVRVLVSIRDDALARLDRFKGRIPNLFANYLRLEHLDRRAARAAIVGPLERYNQLAPGEAPVVAEPAFVEAALDQTTAGRVDLGETGARATTSDVRSGRIEAPYLQLVLERVWEEERAASSSRLRLETLERHGGAEAIVRAHLLRAVEALTAPEKDVAADVFRYLVTPSGTKIAHGVADLAEYADVDQSALLPVLTTLGRERIVRTVDGAGRDGSRYEIFHDVLADAVLGWRRERELERQRQTAERRFRRVLVLAIAAVIALAGMAAIAVFALAQRTEAREERAVARAEARRARARELDATAVSLLASNPEHSLRLAAEAARLSPTRQAEDVLREALIASRLRGLLAADGPVVNAAFSPDGRQILTASVDGKARIYDRGSNRLQRTFDHGGALTGASLSPDGTLLATAGRDGTAMIWSSSSGRRPQILRHRGVVTSASFSRDSTLVATGSLDRSARVWDARSGRAVGTLAHTSPVRAVSFDATGTLVASVADDTTARVFDARSGRLVLTVDQGARVKSAVFSPTGRLLVTTGANRVVRVWSTGSGALVDELRGHKGQVLAAAVASEGKLLATASTDGTARVWDLPRGQLVTPLIGHTNPVTSVAFSPDGFAIVTTSRDRTARIWKPGTGNIRAVLAGHTEVVRKAVYSPDGEAVVTASDDATARVWDPQTQPELSILARLRAAVYDAELSPDGRSVLIGGVRGGSVLDARSGKMIRQLTGKTVTAVAWSSDGNLAATAWRRTATVWDVESGARVRSFRHPGAVNGLAFDPQSGRLATACSDHQARIWSLAGSGVSILRGHRAAVAGVAFAPDGRRLVSASSDETARLWDVRSGARVAVLRGHKDAVTSARFSSNGMQIVTASKDRDARTWDARTGELREILRGHFAVVSDASFSPDGRWVVTAGPITAGLWHASSGRLLLYLRGPAGRVTSGFFDRAGSRIFATSLDGTLRGHRCAVCGGLRSLLALANRRLELTAPPDKKRDRTSDQS